MGISLILLGLLLWTAGLILPLRWLLRVWLDDRLVSAPLAIGALASHVALFTAFIFFQPILATIYCALLLLLIGISPRLTDRIHRKADVQMAEEDIAKYQRLLERDPNHAAAHAALGDACMTCARYDEAISEFERALELDPQNSREAIPKIRRARYLKEESERRKGAANKKPPAEREA